MTCAGGDFAHPGGALRVSYYGHHLGWYQARGWVLLRPPRPNAQKDFSSWELVCTRLCLRHFETYFC